MDFTSWGTMAGSLSSLAPFVDELIYSFDVRVRQQDRHFCFHLDYEQTTYREKELVRLLRDSVEYFALTHEEFERFRNSGNLVTARRTAWSRISTARKDKKGDYGELLLFLLLSFKMPTRVPRFVTKVRLRSARGDQIKGFDCAHCTWEQGKLYLWLGEAKFHQSISGGISSAFTSLEEHWAADYLKNEIRILGANIEANHEIDQTVKAELTKALNNGRSIDRLNFKVPILLTYDSPCIAGNDSVCKKFEKELRVELRKHLAAVKRKRTQVPPNFELQFILMPFHTVASVKDDLEAIEKAMT